jgi:SAM-dependent methyltransferase
MSTTSYVEFDWKTPEAANAESGVGLGELFVEKVKTFQNINRICDLGCGNGYLTNRFAELGYQITGVDASESGIKIASANFPDARFVCAQIDEELSQRLGPQSFDLVISSDVIEHLYSPGSLLAVAKSLLKPNGHVLIGTPYHGYLKNLVLSLSGKMDNHFSSLDDGGHIKFFSVKTLSQLMKAHGFVDLSFSFYGRLPGLWKNMICHGRIEQVN